MTTDDHGPATAPEDELASSARALVLDAFARARQTGKGTWEVMTTAVLKNRLLDLTDRRFNEADYGARDMTAFVRSLPDVVEVTPADSGPSVVRLRDKALVDVPTAPLESTPEEGPRGASSGDRLRPDIWRAAMAWNEDSSFVVDEGRLRPRTANDEGLPIFAPVTEADFLAWKETFIQRESEAADSSSAQLLESWRGVAAPSRNLGKELQDRWMRYLRQQVAARVEQWFKDKGVIAPDDLYVASALQVRNPSGPAISDDRRLKEYVLRCGTCQPLRGS